MHTFRLKLGILLALIALAPADYCSDRFWLGLLFMVPAAYLIGSWIERLLPAAPQAHSAPPAASGTRRTA